MSPWVAVIRALPLTFIVYAVSTVLGALQAIPTGLELGRISTFGIHGGSASIASVESLIALLPVARALGLTLLLSLGAYALITPWLHMSWLAALSEPKTPGKALGDGARLLWRACLTSCWVALGSVLLVAPFALLAWLVRSWFKTRAHVRVQDLATLLFLAPSLLSLSIALCWHDLARARCLSRGAFASARLSLRDAFSLRYLVSYLGWTTLSLGLFVGAHFLVWRKPLHYLGSSLVAVALLQGAALTRSVLRSRWLTQALMAADDFPRGHSKESR